MRRRASGQSLVEMAFVLPILLLLFFGIIDFGYYIYGYATVYQSARNGAEKAAQLPPYPAQVNNPNDLCVRNIMQSVQEDAVMFPDLTQQGNVRIVYPAQRALGQPIEIQVTYEIEPLTPLWQFVMIGNDGRMTVRATARRSIEALGNNPNAANLIACTP